MNAFHQFTPQGFSALSDLLSPDLIDQCLADTDVVTLRKRRLYMEIMVWTIIGMALFRAHSMNQIVSHLDILLPGKRPFVAPSAVVQARQRLGEDVMRLSADARSLPGHHGQRLLCYGFASSLAAGWNRAALDAAITQGHTVSRRQEAGPRIGNG